MLGVGGALEQNKHFGIGNIVGETLKTQLCSESEAEEKEI